MASTSISSDVKRYPISQQLQQTVEQSPGAAEAESYVPRHPLGVKPGGNAVFATRNLQDALGSFARFPDSLLLLVLEYLDGYALQCLGLTCRALFAYSTYDQLWRDIVVNSDHRNFEWRGSWRSSFLRLRSAKLPSVDCSHLFSDALHRPFLCSEISLHPYVSNIPKGNQIPRLPDLSKKDFDQVWNNRPVILTEPVKKWKVFDKWERETLLAEYGDTLFRAESVDWPLRTYIQYMNKTKDESPLYLFDRAFVEKMDIEVGPGGAYQPPDCFGEDFFTLLGQQRPDHRWLIIGPERSGSTFHKDPNATSAWNAVVRGSKYWIMFPSSIIPPGVFMSEDQSEVTSPLSIAEWLLTFHAEARQTPGCLEGICGEGEVLHVPSGYWHLVVNLEKAVAITQNFVPKAHLSEAANFLKYKATQISGFKDDVHNPYGLFMERLKTAHADLEASMSALQHKKRKWEDVVSSIDAEARTSSAGFGFDFGDDELEEVP